MPETNKVVIAGGGTAGHVYAGVEIMRACRELGAEGFFMGSEAGLESRLLTGERLVTIPSHPFARQGWGGRLRALATVAPGILAARRVLREQRADLVVGVGGYASLGPAFAARTLGIPLVLHEANAHPGLASRWLAPFAQRICVGFRDTFAGRTTAFTGNPARWTAAASTLPPVRHRILVLGGSEGSPFLNQYAPDLFTSLARRGLDFGVHHVTGAADPAPVRARYADLRLSAHVDGFLEEMTNAYARATFAITCAGALVLAELAVAGLPALLVPLGSAAGDHQAANARAFAAAPWIPERDWNAEVLADRLLPLLTNASQWTAARQAMLARATPGAAQAIARICMEAIHVD